MTERVKKSGDRYYKRPAREKPPVYTLVPLLMEMQQAMVMNKLEDSPSVTTVLGVMAKPALIGWAANQERKKVAYLAGQLYARLYQITDEPISPDKFVELLIEEAGKTAHREILTEAAHVGTEVHARIEWEFKGELGLERKAEPPNLSSPQANRAFTRWQEWREAVKLKLISTESRVFSTLFGFGGTSDFLAEMEIDGKIVKVLGDFKTGKAVYEEAFLQNVAYRMALAEEGILVEEGVIVRLPKYADDPEFDAVRVPQDPMLRLVFLALTVVYRWVAKGKKEREDKRKNDKKAAETISQGN